MSDATPADAEDAEYEAVRDLLDEVAATPPAPRPEPHA